VAGRPGAGERGAAPRAAAPLALPRNLTAHHRLGELSLEGSSRAGDSTWFRVHPPGFAFDVGRGAAELEGARDVFLTHGHLDHALGLPFVVSRRTMAGQATRVFCPRAMAADLEAFLLAAARMEGAEYRQQIAVLDPGQRVEVAKDLAIEAFAVDHRVPSLGYHLMRRRRRLLPALAGADGADIAARRRGGETVEESFEEVWLSYPGDTGPGVFQLEPRLAQSRVLMLECTFLGEAHRERAMRYGHLHLDDLAAFAPASRNEAIVLYHLSRRYAMGQLRGEIEARLPAIAARVHLFAS
jgi:ribonuclease Z